MKNKKKGIAKATVESIFKTTIGQIPMIGTALNELAFDFSARLKQDRLNTFSIKLTDYFENIGEQQLNIDNILTEDFHDIFEAILYQVARTKSEEKLDRFKSILIGQIKELGSFDEIEIYLDITSRLNDSHITILTDLLEVDENRLANEKILIDSKDKLNRLRTDFSNEKQLDILAKIGHSNSLSGEIDEFVSKHESAYKEKYKKSLAIPKFEILCTTLLSLYLIEKSDILSDSKNNYFYITELGRNYIDFLKIV